MKKPNQMNKLIQMNKPIQSWPSHFVIDKMWNVWPKPKPIQMKKPI